MSEDPSNAGDAANGGQGQVALLSDPVDVIIFRSVLLNSKLEFLQGAVPHTRRQWGL